MNHLGTKTMETDRLILRSFKASDGALMYQNWASDEEVTKFLTWPVHTGRDVSDKLTLLWEKESQDLNQYQWCIVWKETNEPIGSISAVHMRKEIGEIEIGYCIGRAYWNKGIVSEALTRLITFFFDEVGANRVMARHDINNPASGAVMKKCGMQFEGIGRQADRNNQGICDVAYYGILKEDRK